MFILPSPDVNSSPLASAYNHTRSLSRSYRELEPSERNASRSSSERRKYFPMVDEHGLGQWASDWSPFNLWPAACTRFFAHGRPAGVDEMERKAAYVLLSARSNRPLPIRINGFSRFPPGIGRVLHPGRSLNTFGSPFAATSTLISTYTGALEFFKRSGVNRSLKWNFWSFVFTEKNEVYWLRHFYSPIITVIAWTDATAMQLRCSFL